MFKYKGLIVGLLIILFVVGFAGFRITKNKAPINEMKRASKMLTQARNEKSPRFAKSNFEQASRYYDSAMVAWKTQNERFILFRDYQKVSCWAIKSIKASENSVHNARKNKADAHELTRIRMDQTGKLLHQFETFYGKFPIDPVMRSEINTCKIRYTESLQAFKKGNYSMCHANLDWIDITLDTVQMHFKNLLSESFKEYNQWHKMIAHTIDQSKKNKSSALIVDKLARTLSVYKNGVFVKSFSIELGNNWLGNKKQQGDKATPEGVYKIVDKKQNGHTKYYKALLLNYPNDEDKKRFRQNKKHGLISANASIGNLIEIHGNGGKGTDWTDGCIALKNNDVDELFPLCPLGTPVTIVGSVKTLNEIINRIQ